MKSALVYTTFLAPALASLPKPWGKGLRWQVQINAPLAIPADGAPFVPDADIFDIDLWHAHQNRDIVEALHKRNKTVICYFNLGAVQPEDCDFKRWYNNELWTGPWYAEAAGNTPDPRDRYCERYENFAQKKFFDIIKLRIDNATEAGCDGVDPDNIDIWGVKKFGLEPQDVVPALKDLADYTHTKTTKRGNMMLIGQKNAQEIVDKLIDKYDFAVLERCVENGWCGKFAPYLAAQKPVIAIEYPSSLKDETDTDYACDLNGVSQADFDDSCTDLGDGLQDLSRVLKLDFDEYGLNGCTQYCDKGSKAAVALKNEDAETCSFPFPQCDTKQELVDNCCCENCDSNDEKRSMRTLSL